jgi:hypothetical protein
MIGRDQDLDSLVRLLDHNRFVTIVVTRRHRQVQYFIDERQGIARRFPSLSGTQNIAILPMPLGLIKTLVSRLEYLRETHCLAESGDPDADRHDMRRNA